MDGRSILFTKTICLPFNKQKKFFRVQDFYNNGEKADEIYNESINGSNVAIWCSTCLVFRQSQPIMAEPKICISFLNVSFSYVLCEDKKNF